MNHSLKSKKIDFAIVFGYVGLFLVTYFLLLKIVANESSDISMHSVWASDISFLDFTSYFRQVAHPLWHFIMRIFNVFFPRMVAAAMCTALIKVCECYVVSLFLKKITNNLSKRMLFVLSIICISVSTVCIPFYNPKVYIGVGSPNPWHSPTQLLVMVFIFIIVPITIDFLTIFDENKDKEIVFIPTKKLVYFSILLCLATLAKPIFMQAFLPACSIYFGILWIKNPKQHSFFLRILYSVLPSVLLICLQYLYYFAGLFVEQNTVGIVFSLEKILRLTFCSLLMSVFPLYVSIVFKKKPLSITQKLIYLYVIVAFIFNLFFTEVGAHGADGNFGWANMAAIMMFFTVSLGQFVNAWQANKQEHKKITAPFYIGGILLAWHIVSGIYYVGYLFVSKMAL